MDIERLELRVERLTADMATIGVNQPNPPTMESLGDRLAALPDKVSETRRRKLGTYRGLEYGVIQHQFGQLDAYVEGAAKRWTEVRSNAGPRAVMNAVERLVAGYESERDEAKAGIAVKAGPLRDYESRLGTEFAHLAYQCQLTDLRDRLKLGLSEKPPEGGESVSELAEKIRVLREANTVEAAPVRVGTRKVARAETPVTARIRARRAEETGEAVAVEEVKPVEVKVAEVKPAAPVEEPKVIALPDPVKPVEGHRGEVSRRRQGDGRQLRLF